MVEAKYAYAYPHLHSHSWAFGLLQVAIWGQRLETAKATSNFKKTGKVTWQNSMYSKTNTVNTFQPHVSWTAFWKLY